MIVTYVGNKQLRDWNLKKVQIGSDSQGQPIWLNKGESADLTKEQIEYLGRRIKLVAGANAPVDADQADPLKGEKGDPGEDGQDGRDGDPGPPGIFTLVHTGTQYPARPATDDPVMYIGPTEPSAWDPNDLWVKT